MTRGWTVLLIGCVALVGCGDDTPTAPSGPNFPIPEFQIIDVFVGTGQEATTGRRLFVSYEGWLYDPNSSDFKGELFDRNDDFQFVLGDDDIIPGWNQGLVGIRVGGLRRLIIPPELAFGDSGAGSVPPDWPVVFEVRLTVII